MVAHMLEPLTNMMGAEVASEWLVTFGDFRNVLFIFIFLALTAWVISAGVESGIEK